MITRRHLTNDKKEPRRYILHTWPRASRTRQGLVQIAGRDESDEHLLIIARNIKPDSTQNTSHAEHRHDRGKPATNNTNSEFIRYVLVLKQFSIEQSVEWGGQGTLGSDVTLNS